MRLCAGPHFVFAPRPTRYHYYSHPTRDRLKVPILKLEIGRCRQGRMISILTACFAHGFFNQALLH